MELLERVGRIVDEDLAPICGKVDREGLYPEAVLHKLGSAGAYAAHVSGGRDLFAAIAAMACVGEVCLATAFCMWCQDTLAWYLEHTGNDELRTRLLPAVASGELLGGTGLSNPMKAAAGIESLRVTGRRKGDGFLVNGSLPWVSNLGPNHQFGTAFALEGGGIAMALFDCSQEGMRLGDGARFLALDGTRTCSVAFRDVRVARSAVLADPAEPFIARIKPGFILLQAGMGLGLIRGCIDLMRDADEVCGDTNRYLPDRPETFVEALERLTAEISALARTPLETSPDYLRRVLASRLELGDWTLRAAQAAMLHAGARGYLAGAAAQRRLRESYFVAIVTPAIKHLRRELAALDRAC